MCTCDLLIIFDLDPSLLLYDFDKCNASIKMSFIFLLYD
jgi:hypothetical protein